MAKRRVVWPRRGFVALALAAQVGIAATARAQPVDASLTREGIDLRRSGRDAEALAVFKRALALDGSPRTRAQVALAEQALGLWVEAERDLSAALADGEGPWFEEHAKTLHSALDTIRAALGTLDVEANVTGAELWINGTRAGTVPLSAPVRVVSGAVAIEVRAPGFEATTRTIQVAPQTVAREVVELTRVTSKTSAPSEEIEPPPAELLPVPSPNPTRAAAWASLAGAVALATGATVAMLVRDSSAAVYDDDSRCFYGGLTRDQRCGSYRETAMAAQTLGIVGFSAAAAVAGVSVFLFARASKANSPAAGAFRCTLGLGVKCGASF